MLFSCIHSSASNGFSQPGITPLVPECRWTKLHQSCLTLCDPMDCSLSIDFSRQEYWSGLPVPSLGDLPDPGIKPVPLTSPALALAGRFFTTTLPGKPQYWSTYYRKTPMCKRTLTVQTCVIQGSTDLVSSQNSLKG